MTRSVLFVALLASGALVVTAPASQKPESVADVTKPGAIRVFPISELKPGMKGVGRTVFKNGQMETFEVEIIGAMENTSPKQTMVMARLVGGPLANTGVIAGMSGSPVYIEGRLLGAVAYGFPFSKETIAGITPYGEMTGFSRLLDVRGAKEASVGADSIGTRTRRWIGPTLPLPLDASSLADHFDQALTRVEQSLTPRSTGLSPLPLPLSVSGLTGAGFAAAKGIFDRLGFSAVQTPSASAGPGPGPLPPLTPGGPVAVSLIQGDFDFSATGTVTHIDGDSVYAFGHPFFGLGPIDFPMRKAYIYDVFPSLYQSFKISTAHDVVGRFREDRATAISGTMGKGPRMIPVKLTLQNRPGQKQDYSFEVVQDEIFTPLTVFASVSSVLQGQERGAGPSTVDLDATVNFTGFPPVRLQDSFGVGQSGAQAASLVGAVLQFVLSNEFRPLTVDSVNVNLVTRETQETSTIERAWLERSTDIHPGDTVPLKVAIRSHRGEETIETIPIEVPASVATGRYAVMVSDGVAMSAAEQREMRQAFAPKSVEQIFSALSTMRRSRRLYARLQRFEEGAALSGVALPGLPPSMMQILSGNEGGETIVRTGTTVVWENSQPIATLVRGSRFVSLQIER